MSTIKINPLVALEEATQLVEFYRNRNLVNAQGRFDAEAAGRDLAQRVADLTPTEPEAVEPEPKKKGAK